MRRARLLEAVALALLLAAVAAGCGNRSAAPRFFGIADVYYAHGDFEGSGLVQLDARSFQPTGRVLRLGDAITSQALGPDGDTLAFGGYNFGAVLFVDLSQPTRVTRLPVVPRTPAGTEIDVEGWHVRSRLIAVATVEGAWWSPHPSTLLVIDPAAGRVIRRIALHGTVWAASSLKDGTVALVVVSGRIPRLVLVDAEGSIWSRPLRRLDLGSRECLRVQHVSYCAEREPALASDGRSRVFVVVPDRPVAEVLLHPRELRYHRVALPRRYLAYPPPDTPGSGGVHLRYDATAEWLGHDRLAIGGGDEIPGMLRGGGVGHREAPRALEIVDTRAWRRVRTIRASTCTRIRAVILCNAAAGGYPPDGKRSHGASLVAYDAHWDVLYEKRSPDLWWDAIAGRLFAGSPDGTRVSELDPATGYIRFRIRPSPLHNQLWPLELFAYTPPR